MVTVKGGGLDRARNIIEDIGDSFNDPPFSHQFLVAGVFIKVLPRDARSVRNENVCNRCNFSNTRKREIGWEVNRGRINITHRLERIFCNRVKRVFVRIRYVWPIFSSPASFFFSHPSYFARTVCAANKETPQYRTWFKKSFPSPFSGIVCVITPWRGSRGEAVR